MHFSADEVTRELLASQTPTVLLYGGFEGFENYGDVLQLKSAIAFHRRHTGLQPVIVVSMAGWTWPGFLAKLYDDYDIAGVVFEDGELLDTAELGLDIIREVQAGALLHIYGGGYFNEFWGARRAFVCEQLIFSLHVGPYVVSGIQVDESGAGVLRDLFEKKQPELVGARDEVSVQHLSTIVPADRLRFSFDDALEPIEELRGDLLRFGGAESERRSIGLHLNITAEYTSSAQPGTALSAFSKVRAAWPAYGLTLLHAYNDRRRLVADTLDSIGLLGIAELYPTFDVVDLATVAAMRQLSPADLRSLTRVLTGIDVVVTASYHVAITMNLLGRPSFLIASNGYYRDKRQALGLPEDLGAFIRDPQSFLRDFARERRERLDWLSELRGVIAALPGWREPAQALVAEGSSERTALAKYAGR